MRDESYFQSIMNSQSIVFLAKKFISKREAPALASAAEKAPVIQLSLDFNVLKSGAKALARVLENNSFLQSLSLTSNYIGPGTTKVLANSLEKNKSLSTLNLNQNLIKDKGAVAIASALQKNQALTSLDLSGNLITDTGGKALLQAVSENKNIKELSLWNNPISQSILDKIDTIFEKRNGKKQTDKEI